MQGRRAATSPRGSCHLTAPRISGPPPGKAGPRFPGATRASRATISAAKLVGAPPRSPSEGRALAALAPKGASLRLLHAQRDPEADPGNGDSLLSAVAAS